MNPLIQEMKQETNKTRTTNGMKAFKENLDPVVDLFGAIGGMRGQNPLVKFMKAFVSNEELAVRVMLWARDVRGGAGERQLMRIVFKSLCINQPEIAKRVLPKLPELGRWDDVLSAVDTSVWPEAVELIRNALESGDGLCAKWMPREAGAKSGTARKLIKGLGWTPKRYRKTLVELSSTVESLMCSKQWDQIDYSKLPSVASARYQKAFGRNDQERYANYIVSLEKGEAKINAGALYPYDVLRSLTAGNERVAEQQWKALTDYLPEGKSFLPVVDVSGSMSWTATATSGVSCMDVAVSLGLYLSERNKSVFKDTFITFHERPTFHHVAGGLAERVRQTKSAPWGGNTDLMKVFKLILDSAIQGEVAQEDMPETIVILSDMQFDHCVRSDKAALGNIKAIYRDAGYEVPQVVFWNLNHHSNTPVQHNKDGVALVSGFSPAIMKAVLTATTFTPEGVMLETIMDDRYSF